MGHLPYLALRQRPVQLSSMDSNAKERHIYEFGGAGLKESNQCMKLKQLRNIQQKKVEYLNTTSVTGDECKVYPASLLKSAGVGCSSPATILPPAY